MMCKKPFEASPGVYVSCGSCLFCRINRARLWQHRIMLEESCWEVSCFVTLTYDEMRVPYDGSLRPGDLQRFLKRLRRRVFPLKLRFYGVGEYGSRTGRPHYHVCLFGVGTEWKWCPERKAICCFSLNNVVEDSWSCGFVHVGEVTKDSARYVTEYVTKFMNKDDSWRVDGGKLRGRHPEFARMSNRPGIGAPAIMQIAKRLLDSGFPPEKVVAHLNYGTKEFPLGNYLKKKLHKFRNGDVVGEVRALREYLESFNIRYNEWKGGVENPNCFAFILDEKKAERFKVERNPVKKGRLL